MQFPFSSTLFHHFHYRFCLGFHFPFFWFCYFLSEFIDFVEIQLPSIAGRRLATSLSYFPFSLIFPSFWLCCRLVAIWKWCTSILFQKSEHSANKHHTDERTHANQIDRRLFCLNPFVIKSQEIQNKQKKTKEDEAASSVYFLWTWFASVWWPGWRWFLGHSVEWLQVWKEFCQSTRLGSYTGGRIIGGCQKRRARRRKKDKKIQKKIKKKITMRRKDSEAVVWCAVKISKPDSAQLNLALYFTLFPYHHTTTSLYQPKLCLRVKTWWRFSSSDTKQHHLSFTATHSLSS